MVNEWCYMIHNHQRHRAAGGLSTVNYEIREYHPKPEAAYETLHPKVC